MGHQDPRRGDLRGAVDYNQLHQITDVDVLNVETATIGANSTAQFTADEEDENVSSINILPSESELPFVARIPLVRINVASGSTDSDFKVYQSDNFDDINEVVSATAISETSTPTNLIPAGAFGIPFRNKQGENDIYFEIDENSGSDSVYEIEVHWFNLD